MSRNLVRTKLQSIHRKDIYKQFAYPVTIIPIRYWAVKETALNMISTTIIKLLQLKRLTMVQVKKLMGMEQTFSQVIDEEWNQLIIKNFIKPSPDHPDFWEINEKVDLVEYNYEDGYLCFDEMYGKVMPFIFPGTPYFETGSIPYDTVILNNSINLTKDFYDSLDFKKQMEQSVSQFNQTLIEKIKSGDGHLNDMEVALLQDGTEIEKWRVELKSFAALRQAYLPVSVSGEIAVGLNKRQEVRLIAYSPYTNDKSYYFLDILQNIPESKAHLNELEELIKNLEAEDYLREFGVTKDDIEESIERILQMLQGVQLQHEATFELLQNAEWDYLQHERDGELRIGARPSKVSNWYLVLESILRPIAENLEEQNWPTAWRYRGNEAESFLASHMNGFRIPKALQNNLRKVFEDAQHKPLSTIHANGARDLLAIILISDLLKKNSGKDTILLSRLEKEPDILERMDSLIVLRNQKGAHIDMQFNRMNSTLFFEELTKHRQMVYDVIKLFA